MNPQTSKNRLAIYQEKIPNKEMQVTQACKTDG